MGERDKTMTEDHILAHLDDYLDEGLNADHRARIDAHLIDCAECRAELETAQKLRTVLSVLPVDGPGPDFFENAMRKARTVNNRTRQLRRARPWLPAAVAAGLAVMLIGGFLLRQTVTEDDQYAPARAQANITMALEETRTVNLVFESASRVADVILTVDLPMGVELAAYPGRMQLRWETSLQAGKNRLPLELVAIDGMGGEIVATMQSADTEKVFRIDVEVIDG
jgi:predicted anti-sigma-YlaC factor YlaD